MDKFVKYFYVVVVSFFILFVIYSAVFSEGVSMSDRLMKLGVGIPLAIVVCFVSYKFGKFGKLTRSKYLNL